MGRDLPGSSRVTGAPMLRGRSPNAASRGMVLVTAQSTNTLVSVRGSMGTPIRAPATAEMLMG